jgi:hypothetical protein
VTLASGLNRASGIAVDAANVYVALQGSNLGAVVRVPIAGGAVTTIASLPGSAYDLAVDTTDVYWTNLGNGMPSTVMRAPMPAAPPRRP